MLTDEMRKVLLEVGTHRSKDDWMLAPTDEEEVIVRLICYSYLQEQYLLASVDGAPGEERRFIALTDIGNDAYLLLAEIDRLRKREKVLDDALEAAASMLDYVAHNTDHQSKTRTAMLELAAKDARSVLSAKEV